MHMMHDNPLSGHFGVKATYDRIKDRYYWKGILRDVKIYVKSCDCQRRRKPQGKNKLHPIETGEPFERIGIDLLDHYQKQKKEINTLL
jgi:hypothetical protein